MKSATAASVISARIIMTEPQLLSEEQIAEIEAQTSPFQSAYANKIRALCQTVRALTAALHKADEIVVDAIAKTDAAEQNHKRVIAQLEDSRTRLAQVEKERSELQAQVEGEKALDLITERQLKPEVHDALKRAKEQ